MRNAVLILRTNNTQVQNAFPWLGGTKQVILPRPVRYRSCNLSLIPKIARPLIPLSCCLLSLTLALTVFSLPCPRFPVSTHHSFLFPLSCFFFCCLSTLFSQQTSRAHCPNPPLLLSCSRLRKEGLWAAVVVARPRSCILF